jgi:hypothetical protein
MNETYSWNPQYGAATLTILSVSIGFAVYWFLAMNEKLKSLFFKKYSSEKPG